MTNTTKNKKYRDFKLEQLFPTLKHYGIVTESGLDNVAIYHLKRLYVELTAEVVSEIYKATRGKYNVMELSLFTKQPIVVIEDIAKGNFDKDTFMVDSAYYSKIEISRLLNVTMASLSEYDYPEGTQWFKGSDIIDTFKSIDDIGETCNVTEAIDKYDFLNSKLIHTLTKDVTYKSTGKSASIKIYDLSVRVRKSKASTLLSMYDLDKVAIHLKDNYVERSSITFWKNLNPYQKNVVQDKIYSDFGVKITMGMLHYINKTRVQLFKNTAIELGFIKNSEKIA